MIAFGGYGAVRIHDLRKWRIAQVVTVALEVQARALSMVFHDSAILHRHRNTNQVHVMPNDPALQHGVQSRRVAPATRHRQ